MNRLAGAVLSLLGGEIWGNPFLAQCILYCAVGVVCEPISIAKVESKCSYQFITYSLLSLLLFLFASHVVIIYHLTYRLSHHLSLILSLLT